MGKKDHHAPNVMSKSTFEVRYINEKENRDAIAECRVILKLLICIYSVNRNF